MKKMVWAVAGLLCISAFTAPEGEGFKERFQQRMLVLVQQLTQEKVYLHTDRDHYEAGEDVWFRAYLVNSVNHKASFLSGFVYVELRDRQDSLYTRVKIAPYDKVFAGRIPLPEQLPQGDYILRAYSYWMQNAGDEYLFRKRIRVINPRDTKVLAKVSLEEDDRGKVAAIRLTNSAQEPYAKVFVRCTRGEWERVERTDEQGVLRVKLDSAAYGRKIRLQFHEGNPFAFERYLYLPDPEPDFDVAFLPEGGGLLAGCRQLVAFKAIGSDGLSREVQGVVVDDQEKPIAFIQSIHKGMGAFEMVAEPGRKYHARLAVVGGADKAGKPGMEKCFVLPPVQQEGVALRVVSGEHATGYRVLATEGMATGKELYVVAHARGVPLVCHAVTPGEGKQIRNDILPEGIVHLSVMDAAGVVYSQRLCFVRHARRPELAVETDRSHYLIRDTAYLEIALDQLPEPGMTGSFSVAITDDSQVERDSLQDNILSYLLMTSDLKGHIEEPAGFFACTPLLSRRYLDLLMLTQGWTRFDVSKIMNSEYPKIEYYLERGQAISGKVKNFWGRGAEDATLILLGSNGMFRMVQTDTAGHFMIDDILFPDGTDFLLQGKSKRGRRSVEVLLDPEVFLEPQVALPVGQETLAEADGFYQRFFKDYYYDNGIKVYVLDEAVVKRKQPKKTYSFYDHLADYNLDSARLASMKDRDIRTVLQELPGVEAWGEEIRRFGKPLYVLVDDFEEPIDRVFALLPVDLVSVSLLLPPRSQTFWGSAGENGVLAISTNPRFVPRDVSRPNMLTFSLPGYQVPAQFYMPRYEVDSVRLALADTLDMRKTIYWNPDVRTDGQGRARCFFTTSDSEGPYRVVIEGVLGDGTVCRRERLLELR